MSTSSVDLTDRHHRSVSSAGRGRGLTRPRRPPYPDASSPVPLSRGAINFPVVDTRCPKVVIMACFERGHVGSASPQSVGPVAEPCVRVTIVRKKSQRSVPGPPREPARFPHNNISPVSLQGLDTHGYSGARRALGAARVRSPRVGGAGSAAFRRSRAPVPVGGQRQKEDRR